MVLETYSRHLSAIASFATIPMLLSPSVICNDIIKKRTADQIKPFVFIQGLIRSLVFIQWGLLSNIQVILRVHSIGLTLYIVYFSIYYRYCSDKIPAQRSLAKAAIFLVIVLGYVNLQKNSLVTKNFEFVATFVHLGLLALPMLNLKRIIKSKSTAGMPFPIIFCANFLSITWLLYGISINNKAITGQMVISFILTSIQLSLFVIYPTKETKPSNEAKKKD